MRGQLEDLKEVALSLGKMLTNAVFFFDKLSLTIRQEIEVAADLLEERGLKWTATLLRLLPGVMQGVIQQYQKDQIERTIESCCFSLLAHGIAPTVIHLQHPTDALRWGSNFYLRIPDDIIQLEVRPSTYSTEVIVR